MARDPETMTIDELDAESVRLKLDVIEPARAERRALKQIRDRKVTLASLAALLKIDVDGITPEQAETLIALAQRTPPRDGNVVVSPGPGDLNAAAGQPEVN